MVTEAPVAPEWLLERCWRPIASTRIGERDQGNIFFSRELTGCPFTISLEQKGLVQFPMSGDMTAMFVGHEWWCCLLLPGYGDPWRRTPELVFNGNPERMLEDVMLAVLTL